MVKSALVLLAGASGAAAGFIYTGAGGCDVSDTACVPPAAPYSQQINAFSQQTKGGKLYPVANYTTGGTPSWVIVPPDEPGTNTKCLFATLSDINRVVSYEVLAGGALSLVSNVSSGGLSPVYLDHHYAQYPKTGKALLVGNYNGGCAAGGATVASLLVGEKCALSPGDSIAFHGSGPDPTGRQECSHAHSVVVDRYSSDEAAGTIDAFVQDLGADKVYTVALELPTGKLALKHTAVVAAGSGPRHLAVLYTGGSKSKRVAYLVHEMANLVSVHTIDGTGALTLVQTLPTFDNSTGGFSKAAEIAINGNQNSVFVTNRGFGTAATNTVVGYAIDRNNSTLEQKSVTASGVSYPRGMVIAPASDWNYEMMIVAGEGSGNLVSFDASGSDGTLKLPGVTIATDLPTPTTIAFASFV